MAKWDMKAQIPQINVKAFQKKLEANVAELMERSAREFVFQALKKIPVWSGMAQGSFLHVSRALKSKVGIPTKSVVKSTSKRNPSAGAAMADYTLDFTGPLFTFKFSSRVPWLEYLDFKEGYSPTSPWGSLAEAVWGFTSTFKKGAKKVFPKSTEFTSKLRF